MEHAHPECIIKITHLSTGNSWEMVNEDSTVEETVEFIKHLKEKIKRTDDCLSIKGDKTVTMIPQDILRGCVFTVENLTPELSVIV